MQHSFEAPETNPQLWWKVFHRVSILVGLETCLTGGHLLGLNANPRSHATVTAKRCTQSHFAGRDN